MAGIVPLVATANQSVTLSLSGQSVRLDVQTRRTGVYVNVYLNDVLTVAGALALTNTYIVRRAYFGLPGDFSFIDLQGQDDPSYTAFGTRWFLFYSGA